MKEICIVVGWAFFKKELNMSGYLENQFEQMNVYENVAGKDIFCQHKFCFINVCHSKRHYCSLLVIFIVATIHCR